MGKTLKDRYPYVSRVHLRGFASLNIPEEDKQKWRASGGKTRAERESGHQWNTTQARANGLRAYLRQLAGGETFGYRKVKRVLLPETELATELEPWEGERDEEDNQAS